MEKRKLSCTVDENVNWCNHYETQPPKLKIQLILKQEGLNCASPFIYNFSIGGSHSTAQTDSVSKSLLCSEVTGRTTIQSSNSILEYPKKTKTLIQKDKCTSNVHPSIIYNSQDMEATYVSIDRRNKEVVAYVPHMYIHMYTQRHTHTGILLLNHKKMKSSHL